MSTRVRRRRTLIAAVVFTEVHVVAVMLASSAPPASATNPAMSRLWPGALAVACIVSAADGWLCPSTPADAPHRFRDARRRAIAGAATVAICASVIAAVSTPWFIARGHPAAFDGRAVAWAVSAGALSAVLAVASDSVRRRWLRRRRPPR